MITQRTIISIFLVLLMGTIGASLTRAQEGKKATHGKHSDHIMAVPSDLKWVDGPPSLPKGVKFVVVEGDPKAEGLFTMRLKFPANYKIPAHWHPTDEHVTVLEGEFYMGVGEKLDEAKATKLPAGGFAVMSSGTRHFGFTKKNASVIQLHGMGPWGINYVNPDDDPRKQAGS